MLLVRGQNCEEATRNALGEGEESLKEKFRSLILMFMFTLEMGRKVKAVHYNNIVVNKRTTKFLSINCNQSDSL